MLSTVGNIKDICDTCVCIYTYTYEIISFFMGLSLKLKNLTSVEFLFLKHFHKLLFDVFDSVIFL